MTRFQMTRRFLTPPPCFWGTKSLREGNKGIFYFESRFLNFYNICKFYYVYLFVKPNLRTVHISSTSSWMMNLCTKWSTLLQVFYMTSMCSHLITFMKLLKQICENWSLLQMLVSKTKMKISCGGPFNPLFTLSGISRPCVVNVVCFEYQARDFLESVNRGHIISPVY